MKIRVFPADSWGCGYYRLIWPAQVLQSQGHDVDIVMPDMASGIHGEYTTNRTVLDVHIEHDADVFVFQRPTSKVLAGVIKQLVSRGRTVVVDMDDDLSNINPKNPAFRFLHPKRDPHNNWHHVTDACRAASLVTLSTPGLIDRYAKHGRYRILYNYVPEAYLKVDRPAQAGAPVWGWAGALHSHPDDLPLLGTTVQTLKDLGTFKIIGSARGTGRALGLSEDPPASGKVEFDQWPETLSELSLGVAPLADTRFNEAKCLDAQTRISTLRGILPIREVTTDDYVWNDDRWRQVEAVNHEIATTGVELVTKSGRHIKVTNDHKLFSNGDCKLAAQFSSGDSIDLTEDIVGQEEIQTAPWPSDGRASRRDDYNPFSFMDSSDAPVVRITERWGRLLGMYSGDGSIGGQGTSIVISIDGQDQDIINLVSSDITSIGLWPSTNTAKTWDGQVLRRRYVEASSTHLVRFLRSIGVVDGNRRIVTVPEVIWRSPRKVVSAFLSGLFEADGTCGSMENPSPPTITMKHKEFILDVQRLLTSFGIESFVSSRMIAAVRGGEKREYWQLRLRRSGADIFAKEIGFLSERKRKTLEFLTNKPHSNAYKPMSWLDTIVSVTKCMVMPIDLQVEGSVFAAAGFVSHNSWLKPLEYSALGVPWVASASTEYERLSKQGPGGVVVRRNRPKEWTKHVRALLQDEQERAELGEAARDTAGKLTVEGNAWRWAEAWTEA